jgi:phosphatidylinositol 4-kinase
VETQLILARCISARPDLYQIYLTNILSLFLEHGTKIKHIESSDGTPSGLVTKLGSLLFVLKELLQHDDFNPQDDPVPEGLVALYRNFWILCVLFGFVTDTVWPSQAALLVIAQKSPILILDSAKGHLEMDLEYNSILRGNTASNQQHILAALRRDLLAHLPSLNNDIRSFSFAQIVLLLSVYHIETRRSSMGNTCYILRYFMNESVSHGALAQGLEAILECVLDNYIKSSTVKALDQSLGGQMCHQLEKLLPLCCHRLDKVHGLACMVVDRIVHAFPQVFAEKKPITLLLELAQLLWISCFAEYRNEVRSHRTHTLFACLPLVFCIVFAHLPIQIYTGQCDD